ncbi:hypothetical protein ACFWJ4_17745 [Kitasatospora sp. NPDC127067]|uniref:hypothetical protein n=1 Tax=Kitasatospora sp. NPDC127067 TaxID=3347126 RepID=UPI003662EAE5
MMRRRLVGALVSLGAAGVLVGMVPGEAFAASGVLTVSGSRYTNPAPGCYGGKFWPLTVNNDTDTAVLVFEGLNCDGHFAGEVDAGDTAVFDDGNSVLVPR